MGESRPDLSVNWPNWTQPAASRPSASSGQRVTSGQRWRAGRAVRLLSDRLAMPVDLRLRRSQRRLAADRRVRDLAARRAAAGPGHPGAGRRRARSARSPPWAPTPGARIHSSGASCAHRGQRLGVGGADHQPQVVVHVPALRQPRHMFVTAVATGACPSASGQGPAGRSAPGLEVLHSRKTPRSGSCQERRQASLAPGRG